MATKIVNSKKQTVKRRVTKKVVDSAQKVEAPMVFDFKKEILFRFKRLFVILGIIGLLALWWYKTNTWPVVAVVNYRPIFRFEVDQQLFSQSGREVIDGLITKNLITQELRNKKITVTAVEVDAKMAEIKKQFGTEENFKQILAAQGMTEDQVREQITLRLGLEKMVEPSSDSAKLQSEIASFIEDLKAKAKIWTVK